MKDFRSKMGLHNKYQAFGDLNARVLRPALDDINTYGHGHQLQQCEGREKGDRVVIPYR